MIKNRLKHFLGCDPSIFLPAYRAIGPKKHQKLLYSDDTEIVIEGYPRSANTFSVVAFELAQTKPVKIAHHLHVEAQLMQAAYDGKPAVALIRNPEDCFRSLIMRHPKTPLAWLINRYLNFYAAVEKLGDRVLIVTYEEVVNDMGAVIIKINSRFGTNFDVPVHDDAMVKKVFAKIDAINMRIDQGKESHVARPSAFRQEKSKNIDFTGHEKQVRHSLELYQGLVSTI